MDNLLTPDTTAADLQFPSDLHIAADNHAVAGSGKSVYDSVYDVATKGTRLTALSIYNSFVNTGVEVGNWLGADWQKNEAEKQLQGRDDNLAAYYDEHKMGIETAGLIVGSFIPGMLAVKGLKLATAGKGALNFSEATGLLAPMRTAVLEGALAEIEAGPLSLVGSVNAAKTKAIMLGFADQAMQAAAWEIATVATMKANPMLDDASYKDIASDLFFGTLVGGGIGGGIEMLATRKFFKQAYVEAADKRLLRQFLEHPGNINIIEGDKLAVLLNSFDKLPAGTTDVERATLRLTEAQKDMSARKILTDMTKNVDGEKDHDLGNAVWDLLSRMSEGGQSADQIVAKVSRLARIDRLNSISHLHEPEVFHINNFAGGMRADFDTLITNSFQKDATSSLAYRLAPNVTSDQLRIARFGNQYEAEAGSFQGRTLKYDSVKTAFQDGAADMFIDADLRIHVNPKSEVIKQVARKGESRALTAEEALMRSTQGTLPAGAEKLMDNSILLNVKTGAQTTTAFATVGDLSRPADIKLNAKGITYGSNSEPSIQYLENGYNYQGMKPSDANARYVWAHLRSQRNGGAFDKGDVIHVEDIPMLEQMYYSLVKNEGDKLKSLGVKLRDMDGNLQNVPLLEDMKRLLGEQKDSVIAKLASVDKANVEEIAIKANVPVKYIEEGLRAKSIDEMLIPAADHMNVTHVRLNYDISNVAQTEGTIGRGLADVYTRIQYAKQQAGDAAAAYFGKEYERIAIQRTASEAKVTGAGPGVFSSADAEYGTLAQSVELTGQQVRDFYSKKVKDAMDNLLGRHQTIAGDTSGVLGGQLRGLVTALRNTGQQYVFLPEELVAKYATRAHIPEGQSVIALKQSLVRDEAGKIIDWKYDYVPPADIEQGIPFVRPYDPRTGATREGKLTYHRLEPEIADYMKMSGQINDVRLIHENNRRGAMGMSKTLDLGTVYAPAIDTRKYPFVALIRDREGKGGGSSSVAAVVAQSQESLVSKVSQLSKEYDIIYKKTSADYHKVLGDYDYNMNMVDNVVDNDLRRRGILSEFLPNMRTDDVLKEFTDWHTYQETRLARNYVELANAQLFAELRALGEPYVAAATSKMERGTAAFGRTVTNPFDSYIKTALDISEKSEYRLWQDANEKLEAFFSTAFNKAREVFGDAQKGLVSYEKATEILSDYGLKNPYGETFNHIAAWRTANERPFEPVLSRFVQKANSVLAATAIRLDVFQSIVNVISTPVMMIGEMASLEKKAAFKQLTSIAIPDGSGNVMPGKVKMIFNSVNNFFGENSTELMRFYREDVKTVRELGSEFQDMLSRMAITGQESASTLEKLGTDIVNRGAKLSGANWSEEFVRFVASDVARQSFEALGYTGVDLINNIRTFVNRVHGNNIASQRPIAFQGVIGQAIGLFQTYQFNLLQQTFKHIEAGDYKAVAMMTAMQTSLFGLQGLPGFQAINTHIIGNAANNPNHNDTYSTVPQFFDKKLGDYLLYGVTSNWMGSAVYTRGDINPRQVTILPVNPTDIPAVSSGIRFVSNLVNTVQKMNDGGRFGETILNGLEHNGLSRPLAGLAQVVQGYSTTAKGSLISASNDWATIASASRILGARPLDEAVVMDAMYRKTAYDAKDSAQIGQLGEAVKTTLYANKAPTEDEVNQFAAEYAARGGRIENFNRKMIEWSKGANSSVANEVYKHLKSGTAVNVMKIMGGQPLPDFTNASTAPAPVK